MKYSRKDREWLQKLEAQGKLKKKLEPEPELFEDARWLWEAYAVLSSTRRIGPSGLPERIALAEINAFCQLTRIRDEDDIDDLIRVVIALDDVFLEDAMQKKEVADRKRSTERERQAAANRQRR